MTKQLELDLPKQDIPRGQIDQQEYARVINSVGVFVDYVHWTYEEVENYCDANNYWVDRYLDHVDPMTVQRHFKYIGSGHNPCSVARPVYKYDENGKFIGYTEFKEKW